MQVANNTLELRIPPKVVFRAPRPNDRGVQLFLLYNLLGKVRIPQLQGVTPSMASKTKWSGTNAKLTKISAA